jgi:hypothetical protein
MPIWCLKAIEGVNLEQWARERGGLYYGSLDCRGFVVVAKTEAEARHLARNEDRAGREGSVSDRWLDPTVTACTAVADDKSRVIMANWPTG